MGRERLTSAAVNQQRFEHVLDLLRGPQYALHAGSPAAPGDDGEVAGPRLARALAVDHDRHTRREVRLADNELAPAGKLDDNRFYTCRNRRIVRPEPAAPSSSPVPRMISAVSPNGQAWMSEARITCGMIRGSAISLPSASSRIAASEPTRPVIRPSSMKGPRMNQFVAPTSFITSISRRREKIANRIVFPISSVEETSRTITARTKKMSITLAAVSSLCAVFLP